MLVPLFLGRAKSEVLLWLALPHTFRHVGLVFLVPGVIDQPLSPQFANAAAYGDFATGLLALLAVVALHYGWSIRYGITGLFTVVGTVDLLNALRHTDVAPLLGAAWYIPTMLVPLLLVTHVMSFIRLLRRKTADAEVFMSAISAEG